MDTKWFRLDLPPQDRLIGAAFVFVIFAVAHRELTGLPVAGVSAANLALFYMGFTIPGTRFAPTAALLWLAVYAGCLWAGVPHRAFSFTAMAVSHVDRGVRRSVLRRVLSRGRAVLLGYLPDKKQPGISIKLFRFVFRRRGAGAPTKAHRRGIANAGVSHRRAIVRGPLEVRLPHLLHGLGS